MSGGDVSGGGAPDRRLHAVLAAAPIVFTVLFAWRALGGPAGPDPLLTAIAVLFAVAAVAMAVGRHLAGLVFVVAPFALLFSPSAVELSFSLAASDSSWWRWHAVASAVAAGAAGVAGVLAVLSQVVGRPGRTVAVVGSVSGVLAGVAVLAVLLAGRPVTYGDHLDAADRAALPVVDLVSYDFERLPVVLEPGRTWTALLRNPDDAPHTFTVDQLGVDVYVPAGREAVVELTPPGADLVVICTVGDHAELGMVATIEVD